MSFQDIKGQTEIIALLKGYLNSARIPAAYLFCGPEGTGKFLTAKTFAKATNCLEGHFDACAGCRSCLNIANNRHPDVHIIDNKENGSISIEDIRDLKKEISLRPYEARKKIFIVNNAHNLTPEAANALLKILEEPPEDSIIILITHHPDLLPKTVVSRCRILKFTQLKREELESALFKEFGLGRDMAHFLAYFCEGRIGACLNLKDSRIMQEKNALIDNLAASAQASSSRDLSFESRQQMRKYLNILTTWFRDIYLVKTGVAYAQLINLDRRDDLLKIMNRYSWEELEGIFKFISEAFLYLDENVNTKLVLSNLKAQLWKKRSS